MYVYLSGQETPIILSVAFTFPEATPSDWQQAWRSWCEANRLAEYGEVAVEKQGIEIRLPEEVRAKIPGENWLEVGEGDFKEVAVVGSTG